MLVLIGFFGDGCDENNCSASIEIEPAGIKE
jgi:hypothetical protein